MIWLATNTLSEYNNFIILGSQMRSFFIFILQLLFIQNSIVHTTHIYRIMLKNGWHEIIENKIIEGKINTSQPKTSHLFYDNLIGFNEDGS